MAKPHTLNGVHLVEIVIPMTSAELNRAVAAKQAELSDRILALETQAKSGPLAEAEEKELEDLRALGGPDIAQRVLSEKKAVIALRSVTRLQAVHRAQLRDDANKWLMEKMGLGKLEDIEQDAVPDDLGSQWQILFQAADIVSALAPDACAGWKVPETLADWVDVPDYIFTQALIETWALNPQFTFALPQGGK
jgi:hypothetical protein